MKILIETIPHSAQRYPTVGDWQWKSSRKAVIRVSQLSDWRYEALVGLHEAIEAILCKHAGVTEQQVDEFDIAYEAKRQPNDVSEPGNDPSCPCYDQHQFATWVELETATKLGVDWTAYEAEVNSL
jgi:hypothetical protein